MDVVQNNTTISILNTATNGIYCFGYLRTPCGCKYFRHADYKHALPLGSASTKKNCSDACHYCTDAHLGTGADVRLGLLQTWILAYTASYGVHLLVDVVATIVFVVFVVVLVADVVIVHLLSLCPPIYLKFPAPGAGRS